MFSFVCYAVQILSWDILSIIFSRCVCVKAISRTTLLLSKTSVNKDNFLHFSGLQFKVPRPRSFAFCESCTKLILTFGTIDDWQIGFALDVRKLGVVICFAPTGSPASGKIVIRVSISGLSICSKSLSKLQGL